MNKEENKQYKFKGRVSRCIWNGEDFKVYALDINRNDYPDIQLNKYNNVSISELIIGKHRNGATATIELLFERNISNFTNYDKRTEE